VVVDPVAEAIERLTEANDAARVEAEELPHERGDAARASRLVVFDDVAVLSLLLQEVTDERLGLERQEIVDGRGDEEHLLHLPAGPPSAPWPRRRCPPGRASA